MKYNRKIIYLAGFLFSLPVALTSYVNSSFLENYISGNFVGIIYILASVLTILGMFKMPRMLSRLGNRSATLLFSFLFFLSLLVLAFGDRNFIILPAFILYFISSNFIIATLDIFIEDFSKNSKIGGIRGIYLSITSLAWVIAQIISGSIITRSSFRGIYFLSALFMLLVYALFILFLRDFKDPTYKEISVWKTIKLFMRNKHISKIYLINLILKFFYAWMIIYTPLYLHEYLGFAWNEIGIIFSIMLIPFVILDFPLGKLSDKIGEKKMLLIGFCIISIATLVIPFIETKTLWLWALVLLLTRIGAATIETMSESYFFKSVRKEDVGVLSFFRNTTPLSYIIGPALAIPVLLLVPSFEYIFFVLGVILLVGLSISLRLRDVK
ncbi:MAG: MFS transporter [Patescibacteria group bacterium]